MKKKYLAVLAASVAAVSLFAAGCGSSSSTSSSSEKTLVVGTEPTFPPFEFTENEKDVGFDIDLAQAICDKLGYKMEVKNMGFDALIPALQSGQIDLIAAGMDATPERQEKVNFTDVYFKGGYSVVVRKDNTDITGFDSLSGKTVGAQVGSKPVETAQEHGATVKQFDTNTQGWMELEAGTIDAVAIDQAVALYYLQQGGNAKLKLAGEPILSRGVAMATAKDKTDLTQQINKALQDLKESKHRCLPDTSGKTSVFFYACFRHYTLFCFFYVQEMDRRRRMITCFDITIFSGLIIRSIHFHSRVE